MQGHYFQAKEMGKPRSSNWLCTLISKSKYPLASGSDIGVYLNVEYILKLENNLAFQDEKLTQNTIPRIGRNANNE